MRKIIYSLVVLVGTILGTSSTSSAQAVKQGNIITDAYYGVPNLMKTVLKTAYLEGGSTTDVDFGGVGPTGLRAEFMLTDKFGIGTDAWFSGVNLTYKRYDDIDSVYYTDKVSYNRINTLLAFNIHFGDGDKLDVYTSLGAGYANRKLIYETTDPNYIDEEKVKSPVPIGLRLGFGMRYMPIPKVGFSAAIGIGGALLSFGVVSKF